MNRFQEQRATIQYHKYPVETAQKGKQKRGIFAYIGIGILSILLIGFGCLIIIGSISPETEVITGKMLRKKYLSFVEQKKIN